MSLTFNTKTVLTSAILISVLSVAAAFQVSERAPQAAPQAAAQIQTVTITAQRMSAQQKLDFDQQNSTTQTVFIRAKRLSSVQKIAMALQDQAMQVAAVSKKVRGLAHG